MTLANCNTVTPTVVFINTTAKSVPLVVMITDTQCGGPILISVGCGQSSPSNLVLHGRSAMRIEVGADEHVCLAGPGSPPPPAVTSFKFVLDVQDGR